MLILCLGLQQTTTNNFKLNISEFFIELSGDKSSWQTMQIVDNNGNINPVSLILNFSNDQILNISDVSQVMTQQSDTYTLLILPPQPNASQPIPNMILLDKFAKQMNQATSSSSPQTISIGYQVSGKGKAGSNTITATYDNKVYYQPFALESSSSKVKFTFSTKKSNNLPNNSLKIEFVSSTNVAIQNMVLKLNGIYFRLNGIGNPTSSNNTYTYSFTVTANNVFNSPIDKNQNIYFYFENIKNQNVTTIQFYNTSNMFNLYQSQDMIGVNNSVKIVTQGEVENNNQKTGSLNTMQIITISIFAISFLLIFIMLIVCISSYKKGSIKAPIVTDGWSVATDVQITGVKAHRQAQKQPGFKQLLQERKQEKAEKMMLLSQKASQE